MTLRGAYPVGLVFRALVLCALVVLGSLPEALVAHDEAAVPAVVAVEETAGHGEHDRPYADICHPGLDCFLTAIVVPQPSTGFSQEAEKSRFRPRKRDIGAWISAFDPPPPRWKA